MKHWFLSDIHLTDINERNGNYLLRFFYFVNKNPLQHTIYFLGDIFDFWLSDGKAFQNHYKALIDQIKIFKSNGGVMYYFEGNHDFHIDRFWTEYLNIPVIEDGETFDINNLKLRLEHGDFINPDDYKYLNYRSKVRQPWVEWLAHALPGFFWKWLGEGLSQKSRKKTSQYAKNNYQSIKEIIRRFSSILIEKNHYNIVITGHMHVFDIFNLEDKKEIDVRSKLSLDGYFKMSLTENSKFSINLGTWLDLPYAVCIENHFLQVFNLQKNNII